MNIRVLTLSEDGKRIGTSKVFSHLDYVRFEVEFRIFPPNGDMPNAFALAFEYNPVHAQDLITHGFGPPPQRNLFISLYRLADSASGESGKQPIPVEVGSSGGGFDTRVGYKVYSSDLYLTFKDNEEEKKAEASKLLEVLKEEAARTGKHTGISDDSMHHMADFVVSQVNVNPIGRFEIVVEYKPTSVDPGGWAMTARDTIEIRIGKHLFDLKPIRK